MQTSDWLPVAVKLYKLLPGRAIIKQRWLYGLIKRKSLRACTDEQVRKVYNVCFYFVSTPRAWEKVYDSYNRED